MPTHSLETCHISPKAAAWWLGLLLFFACSGCSHFLGTDEPAPKDPNLPLTEAQIPPASMKELELKQARLWARVDELEDEVTRQKEHLKLLERGLTLGLTPDQVQERDESRLPKKTPMRLSHDSPPPTPLVAQAAKPATKSVVIAPSKQPGPSETSTALNPADEQDYQHRLKAAEEEYWAGRFKKAIEDFTNLGQLYGKRIPGGSDKYWIARCWSGQKEYAMAQGHYEDFLNSYPDSPWVPRANVELAQVELEMGLREKALARLQTVLKSYPNEDIAVVARELLKEHFDVNKAL